MPDFPRTAFLLGAGLGTRLRPLTADCPKPLLPIGGRPMVLQAMEKLRAAGTRRFLINTILFGIEPFAGQIRRSTMRQMSTGGKRHTKNGVARLQQ